MYIQYLSIIKDVGREFMHVVREIEQNKTKKREGHRFNTSES